MSPPSSVPKKDPLKILEFKARNVARLKAVTIRPDPSSSVVLLTGKNRQGKTSVINAIWCALAGKASIPSKPIRSGEKNAETTLDLGEFIVTRRFTEKGETLSVTTKEGFKAPSPQKFLSSRLGTRAQNPLEFMRLSPPDQVKALQGMVNVELDLDHLSQISGLPVRDSQGNILKALQDQDPFDLLDSAHKKIYEDRTAINNEAKRLKGAIESIEIPSGMEGALPVSAASLLESRKTLEKQQAANDKVRSDCMLKKQVTDRLREQITQRAKDIYELEQKLTLLRQDKKILEDDLLREHEIFEGMQKAIEALVDPDFTEIDQQIKDSDEINRVAGLVADRKKHLAEHQAATARSAALTEALTTMKEYRTSLIESAGLPVPGLGFENGEVTFNGIPLSQASGREQIEISTAICAAQNPEIGILTIDIGWSELDKSGQAALMEFAAARGLQIWVTKVQEEPGQEGFYIEDGEVVAVDGKIASPVIEDHPTAEANEEESNTITQDINQVSQPVEDASWF